MRDLLFLAVMLTLVPLSLRFPVIGVMGWAWTALLTPNDWLWSYMAMLPFNKIFAVVTLASLLLNARQVRLRMNRTLWLLVGLGLLGTLSAVFAIDQGSAGWDLYSKFVKILLFPFVITAVLRNRLDIHALLLAVALGMGFVGVSEGAFYVASAGGHKIIGNQSVGDNNQLAVALLTVLPIVLYLAAQSEVKFAKFVAYIAAGLIIAAIVGTSSRGGLIGLLALALFRIVRGRRRVLGLVSIAVVGVAILAFAPEHWFHRMDTIGEANQDNSFMGRVVAWKISTMIALDRPFLGGGFHAVQHGFAWGYYGERIGALSFIATPPPDIVPHAAHSIYFEMLGDLGFTGLGFLLVLMAMLYLNAGRIRKLARGHAELAWAEDLAFMLQSSLVTYAVAGAAVSVAYTDLTYILFAVGEIGRRLVTEHLRSTAPGRTGTLLAAMQERRPALSARA